MTLAIVKKLWSILKWLLILFSFRYFPMALDLGCGRGHISKYLTKVGKVVCRG